MTDLAFTERPSSGPAAGLLVLHHGRGTSEHDLIGLADALDPERRLHVVAPGGPLELAGLPGKHWYVVPRVGYPDPDTFAAAYAALGSFHDQLWARTGLGPDQTVLGGFSMGAVMSYATGLGPERPAPAGILPFSGFIPTVEGWSPDLAGRPDLRAFIAHGAQDPVIDVEFSRQAAALLEAGAIDVTYLEAPGPHTILPQHVDAAAGWLASTLGYAPA